MLMQSICSSYLAENQSDSSTIHLDATSHGHAQAHVALIRNPNPPGTDLGRWLGVGLGDAACGISSRDGWLDAHTPKTIHAALAPWGMVCSAGCSSVLPWRRHP